MDKNRQYTFDDWFNNRFFNEKDILGRAVCNDSERYLYLVHSDKMTFETLNEIQTAQAETYEYMVTASLKWEEHRLNRHLKKAIDKERSIKARIDKIESYINGNRAMYYEVMLPRLHRGMKEGAKYIIPEQYEAFRNSKPMHAFVAPMQSLYGVHRTIFEGTGLDLSAALEGTAGLLNFPTDEQLQYVRMEVWVLWQNKLKRLLEETTTAPQGTVGKDISGENNNPMDLIPDSANHGILCSYENNITDLVTKWSAGEEIELCAVFCNLLYETSFFKPNKVRTAITFAKGRYGVNVEPSINKLRKVANKDLMKRKTDAIRRRITGKKYGAI